MHWVLYSISDSTDQLDFSKWSDAILLFLWTTLQVSLLVTFCEAPPDHIGLPLPSWRVPNINDEKIDIIFDAILPRKGIG